MKKKVEAGVKKTQIKVGEPTQKKKMNTEEESEE
jgi:hypothetical protein